MGAISADLPAIFFPAGPMLRGQLEGPDAGQRHPTRGSTGPSAARGTSTTAPGGRSRRASRAPPGHCMTMGTASTMTSIAEDAGPHAQWCLEHSRGAFDARPHGEPDRPPRGRDCVGGPEALGHPERALLRERDHRRHGDRRLDQRHHPSHRAGRPLGITPPPRTLRPDQPARPRRRQPPPERRIPDGRLLRRRRPPRAAEHDQELLHLGCLTCTGQTLADDIAGATVCNDRVILPLDKPLSRAGATFVLRWQPRPRRLRHQAHRRRAAPLEAHRPGRRLQGLRGLKEAASTTST